MSDIDFMDRFAAWLDKPITVSRRFGEGREESTACARLAELIAVNGGTLDVHGWGVISGGGLYGRQGLEQDEAFELMRLSGFIDGVIFAFPEAQALLASRMLALWAAKKVENERQFNG